MRVILLHNPVSGRGAGAMAAQRLLPALQAAGHDVTSVATQAAPAASWLPQSMQGAEALVVVGGDGTVRSIASTAARSGASVLQVPLGTENLLARGLQMRADTESVVQTLAHGNIVEIDLARANGSTMVLMASAGLDAEIVDYVTRNRGASISKWLYVRGLLGCLPRHRPPVCTVHLDGTCVLERAQGWIVVANAPDYGGRIDPTPDAVLNDGLLNVVFLPSSSSWSMLAWVAKSRRGAHLRQPGVLARRARQVQISFESPTSWQLDGEAPDGEQQVSELVVELQTDPMRVLLPSWAQTCRALDVPQLGAPPLRSCNTPTARG